MRSFAASVRRSSTSCSSSRVRGVEQGAARRLVDAARLHADHAILDEVDDADAVRAADRVERRR